MTIRRSMLVLLLLVLPHAARASDTSATAAKRTYRVVLADEDTLQAIAVKPAPFQMVAITMPDSTVRTVTSARIRIILDDDSNDRTASVLDRGETLDETPVHRVKRKAKRPEHVGPRSVTRAFLITETSLVHRVTVSNYGGDDRSDVLAFDVGPMWNVSEGSAVGVTTFFAAGPTGSNHSFVNGGFRARYRRWLSPTSSVEVAPGIILGEDRAGEAVPPGYSVQASFSPSTYITITAELFVMGRDERRYQISTNRETRVRLYERDLLLGFKLGRLPGLVGGAATALFALASAIGAAETNSAVVVP